MYTSRQEHKIPNKLIKNRSWLQTETKGANLVSKHPVNPLTYTQYLLHWSVSAMALS